MHPIIYKIGPLTIYSYGVMLAAAVFLCTFLLQKESKKTSLNLSADGIFDLVFWVVVSGIIGSRIFFIFLNFSDFAENPLEIFMVQHGGLAWQGGLIAGSLTLIFLLKKKRLPIWEALDVLAPYAALGQAIGRIGCFLNGCCYGREVWWGIYFPVHQARLHPTQLYDALGLLFIFVLLKKFQTFKKRHGEITLLYFLLAAGLRFTVEFFRADHAIVFLGLSIFQIISLGIITMALYAYLRIKSR